MVETQGPPAQKRKGRGCLGWGCLVLTAILAVVVLLVGVGAALFFRVPERLGIRKSAAERLLSQTPDREAASAILADLKKAGVDTKGVELYVLPFKEKEGSIAYAVLDTSQGFDFRGVKEDDPITDYLTKLATGEASEKYGIERVALEYRGQGGDSLLTVTASTDTIAGFANGTVSKEQFLQGVDAGGNLPAFIQEVLR